MLVLPTKLYDLDHIFVVSFHKLLANNLFWPIPLLQNLQVMLVASFGDLLAVIHLFRSAHKFSKGERFVLATPKC